MKSLIVMLMSLLPVCATAQPRLVIKPDTVNFGLNGRGYLKASVLLQNSGSDTLVLEKISTNTGAMIAVPGRTKLGASDTTTLKIMYDGHNKSYGPFRKAISIETNELDRLHWLPVLGVICAEGDLPSKCVRPR
jgi:hypothetical protein